MWDSKKEMGVVYSEQAKGLNLEWKMIMMVFILGINGTSNEYICPPLQRISSKVAVADFIPKSAICI